MRRRARWLSPALMLPCILATALAVNGAAPKKSGKPETSPATATPQKADTSPFLKVVRLSDHLEPIILHPNRETEANKKLAELIEQKGRRPNILIIYVDDMRWGDPGVYGGGPALGAPTPNIDRLAAAGLRMTSAYSQPACTPTRAA